MKKIAVVCAPGLGDALILHIASHHLSRAGYDVTTVTPHRFGKWLKDYQFGDAPQADTIFLQHDNSQRSKEIHASQKEVFTFYGSHVLSKHDPLRVGYDYVCDLNQTMVDNVIAALKFLFQIQAGPENGFTPPPELIYRRFRKRVAIHTTSGDPNRNWPHPKFVKVASFLESIGYEPFFLPVFPSLEDLASTIYESGFFLGNDSGPGHLASCLNIPHLIIGRDEKHLRHWRPGWRPGEIITPPTWVPKKLRTRWKIFISSKNVINKLKYRVLNN